MKFERSLFASCLALALLASPTEAQFLGHNFTGDMGLMSGTQGPPGWNVAAMYLRYDGETLRGPDGESIAIDPDEQGSLDANAYAIATKKKLIGFINARFLWETGIRSQLEGTVFTLAASFPIPSISLQ